MVALLCHTPLNAPILLGMTTPSAAHAGTITLGTKTINRLGLGTNRLTDSPEAHNLLNQARELGVNFIDTAYVYQGGQSEITIGNSLAPYPEDLLVATKGGIDVGDDGEVANNNPDFLRANLETSLQRLQTNTIDLYHLHRVDQHVPFTATINTLKEFQDEGKVRLIGLSEVTVEQLKAAVAITPISSVQNQYNVAERGYEDVVEYCSEHQIAFIPWFPLGGLFGGQAKVMSILQPLADKYQVSVQQMALAWLLKRSPMMLPIPGTLSVEHLKINLSAADIELSDIDYSSIG
jgi:pyridoxine 4-dehydrogenase